MIRLNPDATLDCLYVGRYLQDQKASFSIQEIYLFAYLGCLLWLYRQNTVTDWGYTFVGTEFGAPYSKEIDATRKVLLERGYLQKIDDHISLTEPAKHQLSDLTDLSINQDRIECLRAACSSTAAFSIGMVSSALAKEPDLKRSNALPSSRVLLEEAAISQLYEQFEALRNAIGVRSNDLRLPAVVWLSALYRYNETVVGNT